MKFIKIDPPGTFCTQEALRDALKNTGGRTFLDVGCGGGDNSKLLCDAGLTGVGVDFSERALGIAKVTLSPYIGKGQYRLQLGDILDLSLDFVKVDLAISYMVMEHVEDDVAFIRKIAQFVKPGGNIIVAVPVWDIYPTLPRNQAVSTAGRRCASATPIHSSTPISGITSKP